MNTFFDPLWGYKLTYPDSWVSQRNGEIQAFAAHLEALNREYIGFQAGYLLVRGEFNHTGESIDPLWEAHITKISLMVGAKNVGAAPLKIGSGSGYEAEIVMPKTKRQRLWTGILSYGLTILHLMVEHPLDQRDWFEPLATSIIKDLHFIQHVPDLTTAEGNIPLPPGFEPADPCAILTDVNASEEWLAFSGQASVDSLQAFYIRELPSYDWEISEFIPYPNQTTIPFARLNLNREGQTTVLGILPEAKGQQTSAIVIRY
ncbi:MAG: hypothetical protein JW757_01750 [Anaerolineales bacterium]|nr:hypothetical protein [Anaerolineales bacterium]